MYTIKKLFTTNFGGLLIALLFVSGIEGKAIKKTSVTATTPITEVTEEIQTEPTLKTIPSGSKTIRKNTSKNIVTVNGQEISCEGSITTIDGEFFCNGKKIKPTAISPETKKIIEQSQVLSRDLTEQAQRITKQSQDLTEQAQRMAKQYPAKSKKMTGGTTTIQSGNGMVTVNGRSVSCNGSVTVTNDEVFCNGKKVFPKK
jgi:uncharacterized Zn-binding protein involved in type VI secretion